MVLAFSSDGVCMRLAFIFLMLLLGCKSECSFKSGDSEELNVLHNPDYAGYAKARWVSSDFPLVIYASDDTPTNVKSLLEKSVSVVNKASKCVVFTVKYLDKDNIKFGGILQYKDITFRTLKERLGLNEETLLTYLKSGDPTHQGRLYSAEIDLYLNDYRDSEIEKIITHSLLHAVGLDHDESKKSVMNIDAASSDGIIESVDAVYVRDQCRTFVP